jgi:hypothetical protein
MEIGYYLLLSHFLKNVINEYIKIKSGNKRNILSLNKKREC